MDKVTTFGFLLDEYFPYSYKFRSSCYETSKKAGLLHTKSLSSRIALLKITERHEISLILPINVCSGQASAETISSADPNLVFFRPLI